MKPHPRMIPLSLALVLSIGLFACAPEEQAENHSEEQISQQSTSPAQSPAAAQSPATARSARVALLEGEASISSPQGPIAVKVDQLVAPGQTLRTGSDSRVELLLADGSRLRVSPAAEVRFAVQTASDDALFQVAKGEVWGNIRSAKRRLVMQGKHSTAAVLGTVYNIKVTDKDTCTRVMEGKVGVHRPLTGDEALNQAPEGLNPANGLKPLQEGDMVVPEKDWMTLAKHQCIVVKADHTAHVMKIDPEQLAKEEAWVKWNRERDAALPPH